MWAANPKTELSPLFYVPFLISWFAIMGSYFNFRSLVAPKALKLWANEQGFKIVQNAEAGLFKRFATRPSNVQIVYAIVIIDGSGATRSGLVKLGAYWWPSFSPARCPIEVYWDGAKAVDSWREI